VFAFLAEHRGEVFPSELFVDLFPSSTGRPSLPGEVAASVLVLQTLQDLSDRDAVVAVRCDIRWKVACGLPLDHEGFHPSTLTYWRRRLAVSDRPNRIFDAVRAVIVQTGVLTGKTRRALDSVVCDDAVATQHTITGLIAAIRRVRREVPGAAEIIAARCHAHDCNDPGKPDIAWDDNQAREALVSALVGDATSIVCALTEAKLDERAAQALALLALVAGQDVEPAEGSDGTFVQEPVLQRDMGNAYLMLCRLPEPRQPVSAGGSRRAPFPPEHGLRSPGGAPGRANAMSPGAPPAPHEARETHDPPGRAGSAAGPCCAWPRPAGRRLVRCWSGAGSSRP
jgi:hypothetical protein